MKFSKTNILFLIGPVLIFCDCFINNNAPLKIDAKKNPMDTSKVNIRYIVHDVEKSIKFYTDVLEFKAISQVGSGFAVVNKGNLNLLLSKVGSGGTGKPMPDGTIAQPGGWNRIQIKTENLEKLMSLLKLLNVKFKNEVVEGNGGKQILLEDPSGNLIELFEANYK